MRIAVLRGGPSKYYDKSLKTGDFVLSQIRASGEHEPVDIFISRDGLWHREGLARLPESALSGVQLVWNGLHGEYGEDGEVSRVLERLHIPHTGSGDLGLSMAMRRGLVKDLYQRHKLHTPKHEILPANAPIEAVLTIFRTYLHPIVVKPVTNRRFEDVRLVQSFEELKLALAEIFKLAEAALVEEFVRGDEVSCGVLEDFRGEELYTLVPTPSLSNPNLHRRIGSMARDAHRALGLRHYSTSEFVVTPKGKVYIIDTNALPELHEDSPFVKSLGQVGLQPKAFFEHIISLAK